ncbi:MAG: DUF2244 domain-containing protein [Gammaproteobacteria bacterium]|nr:DUF2244 domain-containing protein [Gammaproteobacteria bacterium]
MIDASADPSRSYFQATIKPNQSLSLSAMLGLFVSLTLVAMAIGFYLATLGAWMVLPFAGLELLVVGVVLVTVSRHTNDYELIIVDDSAVRVTRRLGAREISYEFQRYWTKVFLEPGLHRWHPSRLLIGSHGRRIALGGCLTEEARREFATQLQRAIRLG